MTSCTNPCTIDGKSYTFSKDEVTFETAQTRCQTLNQGKLAQDLNKSVYTALLKCCPDRNSYWINLKNVNERKCKPNSRGFQWFGGKTCVDVSPLKLDAQHVKENECKAVIIETYPSDTKPDIPIAKVKNCDHKNINYICQKEQIVATSATRAKSTTISHKITDLTTFISKTSPFTETKTSTLLPNEISGSASTSSVEAIAGTLTFCFLLLLLAGFFLYRKKRRYVSKKLNCFQFMKKSNKPTDETMIKETYFKVERSSGKHHTEVINSFVDESNLHGEAAAFENPLEGYTSVNEYQELGRPYEEANIYQEVPESKVQQEKSYDRLNIDGQRVDDASSLYSHATETVSQNMEESLDEPQLAVCATVDKNRSSSTNCIYAVVDKSRPKQQ